MFKPFLMGAAFCGLAACATPPTPSTADSMAVAAESDEELICKKEPVAGSLIKEEICMTRMQWSGKAQEGADMAADAQRRALQTCASGPSCGGG